MHPRWKIALRCLPLCLGGGAVAREAVEGRAAGGRPVAVTASICSTSSCFLPLKAARWRVALTDPPPFRRVLAATIEGLLANAAIGFGSGDVVRAARCARAAWPPTTRARGPSVGPRCWARRAVFVTALVTGLGTAPLVVSGLAVVAYVVVLAAGRSLVPRLGRWPRVQRALSSGLQASTPRRVQRWRRCRWSGGAASS